MDLRLDSPGSPFSGGGISEATALEVCFLKGAAVVAADLVLPVQQVSSLFLIG